MIITLRHIPCIVSPFMLVERRDPLAGLEMSESNSVIAKQCRRRIYAYMIATRGEKYRLFLCALRNLKYLACQPKRGELLESIYAFMRYLDDVADGDVPLPNGHSSAADFIQEKIELANGEREPNDAADKLLLYCFELANQTGEDYLSETNDILSSLHFDAKRRNPDMPITFPRSELQHHFHLLDIRGTIGACLKLSQEKGVRHDDLQPLGDASRIYYTLRDFDEDIRTGFNNVPIEDAQSLDIKPEDMRDSSSRKMRLWFNREAQRGMSMLQEHSIELPKMPLRRLTKAALWWVYERPAKKFFQHVLGQHE